MSYCTATDLIAYANKARLISQLASADYGAVPTGDDVLAYFLHGTASAEQAEGLLLLKERVEQVIDQAASEINGLLALCPPSLTLPSATLTTMNLDMALARLFEKLADDSQIKRQADRWMAWLDKIATGKIPVNTNEPAKPVSTGGAAVASTDLVFSEDTLNGY